MMSRNVTQFILFYRWPQKLALVGLSILATVFAVAIPWAQYNFLHTLDLTSLFIAALLTFLSAISFQLTNYFGQTEALKAQKILGEDTYQKALELKEASLQKRTVGEIVSLYSTDVPSSTMWLEQSIPYFLTSIFPLLVAPVLLDMVYDIPWYFTMSFVFVLLSFNLYMALRQSRFFFLFKQLAAERMGVVNEWIQNIRAIKVLSWIDSFERRILKKRIFETENRIAMVTNGQIMNSFSSTINFWINLFVLSIALLVTNRQFTGAQILTIVWVCGIFLSRPLRQLPWLLTMFFDAKTSIARVQGLLQLENTDSKIGAIKNADVEAIRLCVLKNLNLQLNGNTILKNINLHIMPGELVALIGPISSGKSTLLKSIAGEFPIQSDEFEVTPAVDYLPQQPFVLSATIQENVLMRYSEGDKASTGFKSDLNVEKSLREAGLDYELNKQVLKESTLIGERGLNLSGGQKQRLALARTLFRHPKLFLLDDPLSAVDLKTEQHIVSTILSAAREQSSFLIATHRFSILPHCDRVIYMKDGRVRWVGRPDEISQQTEVNQFIQGVSNEN